MSYKSESNVIKENQESVDNKVEYTFVFVFDNEYLYPFLVTLYSLVKNTKSALNINVAYNDFILSSKSHEIVTEMASLLSIKINFVKIENLNGLPTSNGFNTTPYGKIAVIKHLSGTFAYLDCDTLVISDVSDLFVTENLPNTQEVLSACPDPWGLQSFTQNQAVIKAKHRYFNTGVMLINSEGWKTKNLDHLLAEVLDNYVSLNFEWPDQCTLNYLVSHFYKELHSNFNCIVSDEKKPLTQAKILHYAGSHRKPWRLPWNFLHRLIYLQERILRFEYVQYIKVEKRLFKELKAANINLAKMILELRKQEFLRSNHVTDLIYFRLEATRLGPLIKFLYRRLKLITT